LYWLGLSLSSGFAARLQQADASASPGKYLQRKVTLQSRAASWRLRFSQRAMFQVLFQNLLRLSKSFNIYRLLQRL